MFTLYNYAQQRAEVDHVWAGLRPVRSPLRIEKEIIKVENDQLTVSVK